MGRKERDSSPAGALFACLAGWCPLHFRCTLDTASCCLEARHIFFPAKRLELEIICAPRSKRGRTGGRQRSSRRVGAAEASHRRIPSTAARKERKREALSSSLSCPLDQLRAFPPQLTYSWRQQSERSSPFEARGSKQEQHSAAREIQESKKAGEKKGGVTKLTCDDAEEKSSPLPSLLLLSSPSLSSQMSPPR